MQCSYSTLDSRYVDWFVISILLGVRYITLFIKNKSGRVEIDDFTRQTIQKNVNTARTHEQNLYTLDNRACMGKLYITLQSHEVSTIFREKKNTMIKNYLFFQISLFVISTLRVRVKVDKMPFLVFSREYKSRI